MQVRRAILDQLRETAPNNDFNQLTSTLYKYKWMLSNDLLPDIDQSLLEKAFPFPRKESINVIDQISKINSLTEDFINEMRQNSYELPKGARRHTYALDCSSYVGVWITFKNTVLKMIQEFKKDTSHGVNQYASKLNIIISMLNIDNITDAFTSYYPGYLEKSLKKKVEENDFNLGEMVLDQTANKRKSTVKIQWNGTNRALYDLFAQLTLIDTKSGKRLVGNTLKEVACFLADNIEGVPAAITIERELEKMREPQGIEKAKRGRIDLNIMKE